MSALNCRCSVYADRPYACRRYPHEDAQILFEACVFVRREEGRLVVESSTTSSADESAACRACGRCCYGWEPGAGAPRPVVRCSHLEVMVLDPKAVVHPEQLSMLRVEQAEPFS